MYSDHNDGFVVYYRIEKKLFAEHERRQTCGELQTQADLVIWAQKHFMLVQQPNQ